ncbi:hypothetical protein ACHAXT_000250 [Thalassiosira profunda]
MRARAATPAALSAAWLLSHAAAPVRAEFWSNFADTTEDEMPLEELAFAEELSMSLPTMPEGEPANTASPTRNPSPSPTASPTPSPTPPRDATISGLAFLDLDRDGAYDPSAVGDRDPANPLSSATIGDAPLQGIAVSAFSCFDGSRVGFTRTDGDGEYSFVIPWSTLPDPTTSSGLSGEGKGCYYIQFTAPEGVVPNAEYTTPRNGETNDIFLARGDAVTDVDVGLYEGTPEPTWDPTPAPTPWSSEGGSQGGSGWVQDSFTTFPTGGGAMSPFPTTSQPTAEPAPSPAPTPRPSKAPVTPDRGDLLQAELDLVLVDPAWQTAEFDFSKSFWVGFGTPLFPDTETATEVQQPTGATDPTGSTDPAGSTNPTGTTDPTGPTVLTSSTNLAGSTDSTGSTDPAGFQLTEASGPNAPTLPSEPSVPLQLESATENETEVQQPTGPTAPSLPLFFGEPVDGEPLLEQASLNEVVDVRAVGDSATTTSGQPIKVAVLFNDYVIKDGMPEFGQDLVLESVVASGLHGNCAVEGKGLLYTPGEGYAGPDKCGYKVCHENGVACDYATVSIQVAKQATSEVVAVDENRPDVNLDPLKPVPEQEPPMIDPEALLTEEVWAEVEENPNQGLSPGANTTGEEEASSDVDVTLVIPEFVPDPVFNFTSNCSDAEVLLTFELQTDKHGEDVTWEIFREYGDNSSMLVVSRGPYGQYSFDQVDICVPSPSKFTFIIHDEWGDGLCGGQVTCGYYKLSLDGRVIVHANHYANNNTHLINVGYDATSGMTERDAQYLEAHNWRRKEWHERYNVSYIPLMWSDALAEESRQWAVQLLDACDSDGIEHEPGVREGENLAKNKGLIEANGTGWGQLYHPENITRRWVEREIGWAYPDNAHLSQALWRSSRYMGCGESEKDYNGGKCRVQVCRYVRAGNCDMGAYNSSEPTLLPEAIDLGYAEGENWLIPMLKDTSPCEPSCPTGGCY